jgi:7-cyano-7-deazaguanine synthase in queuosine biosynthesis
LKGLAMGTLDARFCVTIAEEHTAPITLTAGEHFRLHPSRVVVDGIGQLTARQVDLVRWGVAIHLADRWAKRLRQTNGHRRPVVEVELLDPAFWERPETASRLKRCVDFLSGDDDWSFRPRKDLLTHHTRQRTLFVGVGPKPILSVYSGGLDSAAGLAARLAESEGQEFLPVTVRYQSRRGRLVQEHFDLLRSHGLAQSKQIQPVQVGAYILNDRLRRDFGIRLREVTHRCRPFLFLSVAGLVASLEAVDAVEVYESGVGAVNLPLVSGGPAWRTTRSTHPEFLRRMGELVSHVNDSDVRYRLPFLHRTKGEMAGNLARLGLAELALNSVSCITHPLRRGHTQRQCGYCPACVFRRQALWHAGIREPTDFYLTDVFGGQPTERQLAALIAFRQQAARLADLDGPVVPAFFRRHLLSTQIVSSDEELAPFVSLFRRYRREWIALERDARLPTPGGRGLVEVGGGTSP